MWFAQVIEKNYSTRVINGKLYEILASAESANGCYDNNINNKHQGDS